MLSDNALASLTEPSMHVRASERKDPGYEHGLQSDHNLTSRGYLLAYFYPQFYVNKKYKNGQAATGFYLPVDMTSKF